MTKHTERREFGRRQSAGTAWIKIPGRPKLACRVLDESCKGALLELQVPAWLPFQFELFFESNNAVHTCEIRHSGANRLGVYFVDFANAPVRRSAAGEADDWMGQPPEKKYQR